LSGSRKKYGITLECGTESLVRYLPYHCIRNILD
jgi:hypothetical protein